MKILFDIDHPAHVHFFRNLIAILEKEGHEILITAREKEMTTYLLEKYGLEYRPLSKMQKGILGLGRELLQHEWGVYRILKKETPDLCAAIGGPFIVHACKLLSIPSIVFYDTEHDTLQNCITYPFSDVICTPSCYRDDLGKKQIRYNGYHELAYLHPERFTPNPAILDEIGMSKDDSLIILRFVSWGASHDVGQQGIKNKIELVRKLEKYGRVLITSEAAMEKDLERYKIKVSPEKIHDLLYYATLYMGEGSTMASESAVLGTHAIYVNTLRSGTTDEQEEKYKLVYNFSDKKTMEKDAFDKAVELLENYRLRALGKEKRECLLKDKIDVTEFMKDLVVKTAVS